MQGKIITWFDHRGFGFVRPDDSPTEVFVHISDVSNPDLLAVNTRISFELGKFGGRPKAVRVDVLADGGAR